jgi:hypothetical protein
VKNERIKINREGRERSEMRGRIMYVLNFGRKEPSGRLVVDLVVDNLTQVLSVVQ